jgi:hypothetical protein
VGRLFIADGPRGILTIHFMDGKGPEPFEMMGGKFDIVEDQAAADRIGEEIRRFVAGELEDVEPARADRRPDQAGQRALRRAR